MAEWKFGTVVRRAVTQRPLVYQYLMFIGWSRLNSTGPSELFRAIRLNTVSADTRGQKGWTGSHLNSDLFEEAPDE